VSVPSAVDIKMAVEKLKRFKSPSIDQIPLELIKAEGRTIRFEILQLIPFGIRRNCLSCGRSQSLYPFIRRGQNNVVIIEESLFSAIYKIQPNTLFSELTPHVDEITFQFGTQK